MPALTSSWTRPAIVLALIAACLPIASCGWRQTMIFPSPSRKYAIAIWQTRLDNSWGARVELITPKRRSTVYEVHRDAIIYFVHVYWSPDEDKVGMVASGFAIFKLALDVKSGQEIAFEALRKQVATSIRATYETPPGKDPIEWAYSYEAQTAFYRRYHSVFRLSYW